MFLLRTRGFWELLHLEYFVLALSFTKHIHTRYVLGFFKDQENECETDMRQKRRSIRLISVQVEIDSSVTLLKNKYFILKYLYNNNDQLKSC